MVCECVCVGVGGGEQEREGTTVPAPHCRRPGRGQHGSIAEISPVPVVSPMGKHRVNSTQAARTIPQVYGLTKSHLFLIVLEARKSKIRGPTCHGPLLGLQVTASLLYCYMAERQIVFLLCVLPRESVPSVSLYPSDLSCSPRPHL